MKAAEFRTWMEAFDRMSRGQRDKLREQLQRGACGDKGVGLIEQSLAGQPVCPHCAGAETYRWGKSCGLQRYRCRSCKHTFNALTGTPLAGLRHKDKWLDYGQAMVRGSSIREAAASCGIAKNTSFKWRHRFLALPDGQKADRLAGIAEADETYFLESFKGQRRLPRIARKRGGKASKRGTSAEQIPVLVVRDRTGNTADFVLDKADREHIEAALGPVLSKDAVLYSDGGKALAAAAARGMGITHRPVNLSAGIRVVANVYHVQNVYAYDSRLKEWMRHFHGVATRCLPRYLGWHRMIDRLGQGATPTACLLASIGRTGQFQHAIVT